MDEKYIRRFWEKSKTNYENSYNGEFCQEWTGGRRENGDEYGVFRYGEKIEYSHRFSWLITNGEIPIGRFVLHHCDNRWCINPNHLFLGTAKENAQDMVSKKRIGTRERKLNSEDVIKIREMWNSGKFFQHELAEKFSVSISHMFNIINNNSWKKVG